MDCNHKGVKNTYPKFCEKIPLQNSPKPSCKISKMRKISETLIFNTAQAFPHMRCLHSHLRIRCCGQKCAPAETAGPLKSRICGAILASAGFADAHSPSHLRSPHTSPVRICANTHLRPRRCGKFLADVANSSHL